MKNVLVCLLLCLACSKGSEPASSEHAPANVAPGSHEDWCGEHEVPESLCTRCNPSLIPAFQATNDWCAEHGLPESQCKICNPELRIERPPPGT
jgi:hypothetical protein